MNTRLTHLCEFGDKRKNREPMLKIRNKLFELENIEDMLGIELVTFVKALEHGFYRYRPNARNNVICFISKPKVDMKRKCFTYGSYGKSYFKDYGKTWALTEKELL